MLDPKEERKYTQLAKLGQELHLPIPEHFIKCEVIDRNGKVIQALEQRSHSWTRNAYNILFSNMAAKDADDETIFGGGKLNVKLTTGGVADGSIVGKETG